MKRTLITGTSKGIGKKLLNYYLNKGHKVISISRSPINIDNNNLLHIQQPCWNQGIWRWYMKDNKDDLYYLFHAIRRYYKWYKPQNNKVYNYILTLAIKGITKLTIIPFQNLRSLIFYIKINF